MKIIIWKKKFECIHVSNADFNRFACNNTYQSLHRRRFSSSDADRTRTSDLSGWFGWVRTAELNKAKIFTPVRFRFGRRRTSVGIANSDTYSLIVSTDFSIQYLELVNYFCSELRKNVSLIIRKRFKMRQPTRDQPHELILLLILHYSSINMIYSFSPSTIRLITIYALNLLKLILLENNTSNANAF